MGSEFLVAVAVAVLGVVMLTAVFTSTVINRGRAQAEEKAWRAGHAEGVEGWREACSQAYRDGVEVGVKQAQRTAVDAMFMPPQDGVLQLPAVELPRNPYE